MRASHFLKIKHISMFFFSRSRLFPFASLFIISFVTHFTVFLSVELWLANFPGKEQNKSAKRSRSIAKLAWIFPQNAC